MKLIDEGLKEVFKRLEITDIIKGYGYLVSSGSYSRIEAMSNALYYFDIDTVNGYDLVIRHEYRNSDPTLSFYKLCDEPHLKDYIEFCLSKDKNIPYDAYDVVIEFDELSNIDTQFLLKEFKGLNISKYHEREHSVINGVIHDGDYCDAVEDEPILRGETEVERAEDTRVERRHDGTRVQPYRSVHEWARETIVDREVVSDEEEDREVEDGDFEGDTLDGTYTGYFSGATSGIIHTDNITTDNVVHGNLTIGGLEDGDTVRTFEMPSDFSANDIRYSYGELSHPTNSINELIQTLSQRIADNHINTDDGQLTDALERLRNLQRGIEE